MIESHCVDSIIIADGRVGTLADRLAKLSSQNKVTKSGARSGKESLFDSRLPQENSYWEVDRS